MWLLYDIMIYNDIYIWIIDIWSWGWLKHVATHLLTCVVKCQGTAMHVLLYTKPKWVKLSLTWEILTKNHLEYPGIVFLCISGVPLISLPLPGPFLSHQQVANHGALLPMLIGRRIEPPDLKHLLRRWCWRNDASMRRTKQKMTARVAMDTSIRDNDVIMLCLFRKKKVFIQRGMGISPNMGSVAWTCAVASPAPWNQMMVMKKYWKQ